MARSNGRYFLVERYLPSTSIASIEAATARLSDSGDSREPAVRHVVTLVVPGEDTCLSVFEATSAEAVASINRRVAFPHDRIVEVHLLAEKPKSLTTSKAVPMIRS